MRRSAPPAGRASGRAVVLHPYRKSAAGGRSPDARLEEAVGLARAIFLDVVAAESLAVGRPRPATYLGTGRIESVGRSVADGKAGLVCFDAALTPVQQRNLERAWNCKVVDRTGLILEIFGARARTREGRLQVELAQLSYRRSRLVRAWTHLERQRGGLGFVGGPGETQIEADRRQIDDRIAVIRRALETVKRTRALHRRARRRIPYPVVALVGYTNAGKSTLFNRLTRAKTFADDSLFATLDPTMRALELPSGRSVVLSDTVGFVSDLPTDLIAAFGATLEEVVEAEIVVHVRDASHPDSEAQKTDVLSVLGGLGIDADGGVPILEVFNKIDRMDAADRARLANRAARRKDGATVSALTGEGCSALLELLDVRLAAARRTARLSVALTDGAAIAWLYRHGRVTGRRDDERFAHLEVRLDAVDLSRFERRAFLSPSGA